MLDGTGEGESDVIQIDTHNLSYFFIMSFFVIPSV
jgi:hypothetical protein